MTHPYHHALSSVKQHAQFLTALQLRRPILPEQRNRSKLREITRHNPWLGITKLADVRISFDR